jgi:H+/Cl- antiporter ClcA
MLAIVAVSGFFWASWRWPTFSLFNLSLGWCGAATALVLAGMIFSKIVIRIVRYRETLNRIAIGIVLALFGWLIARLHIHVFDKWYLRSGKIDRIIKVGGK